MKYIKIAVIFSQVLCCLAVKAQDLKGAFSDNVMAVSYDTGAGVSQTDGTNKAEAYDVAIFLNDKSLIGKQIVGLRIPIINSEGIANLSGWLSSELRTLDIDGVSVNAPSISSKAIDAVSGWSDVVFDEPYVISEEGVYAGYSLEITKTNNQNLKPIATTSEVNKGGYYLRTSRTRKYKEWYCPFDANEDKGSLRLQVMVAGMEGDAASVELYPIVNVQSGISASIPATLYCHGFNGIASVEYDYVSDGYNGHGSLTLETPVEACYNKFANVELPIDPITDLGEKTLSLTITKVNGKDNQDSQASSECALYVFDFVPKHIPLVEEYSGTWCGNCPRGLASMEIMKERHGEDFICLTYHNEDPMALSLSYPSVIRGFPDCWIDRRKNTDPFFGDRSDGLYHFEEEWSTINLMPASVALDVSAEWADNDMTMLKAKATLKSQIEYFDYGLSLGFVLVADDLHGDTWYQMNYYSGDDTCEELAEIAAQPAVILGMHFNDVVILGENVDGSVNNLPQNIKPMTEYEVEHIFVLDDAVNYSGESLIQDKEKLKVVVIAIDSDSGTVENCCQSSYIVSSGVTDLMSESGIPIKTEYFDIYGIRVNSPRKGIYLKRSYYSDGKVFTSKVILN